jgi:hypothetical protein
VVNLDYSKCGEALECFTNRSATHSKLESQTVDGWEPVAITEFAGRDPPLNLLSDCQWNFRASRALQQSNHCRRLLRSPDVFDDESLSMTRVTRCGSQAQMDDENTVNLNKLTLR